MPKTLLVLCSAKTEAIDPRDRISGLGGDGWTATRKQVVRDIEKGLADYFVFIGRMARRSGSRLCAVRTV
jgi:hypothetical protein